jgi:hypothetical protein
MIHVERARKCERERVSSMAEGVIIEKSLWVCYNIHRSRESEKEMRERERLDERKWIERQWERTRT